MLSAAAICLVIAISDGDTLRLRCGEPGAFQQVTVRLAEVDAPERGQPYARRSTASLAALCWGSWATLRPEKEDRYGRTVGRVECRGKDASAEQVRAGMAWAFTRYLTDPAIRRFEVDAKVAGTGLWREADPMPPWEWRAQIRARTVNR